MPTPKHRNRPRSANKLTTGAMNHAKARPAGSVAGAQLNVDATHIKDPAAVSLGHRGGVKGGIARAAKLSATRRSEIAKLAADKRWGN
jgi:hypothetical protein